jgi:hypothetical protein
MLHPFEYWWSTLLIYRSKANFSHETLKTFIFFSQKAEVYLKAHRLCIINGILNTGGIIGFEVDRLQWDRRKVGTVYVVEIKLKSIETQLLLEFYLWRKLLWLFLSCALFYFVFMFRLPIPFLFTNLKISLHRLLHSCLLECPKWILVFLK